MKAVLENLLQLSTETEVVEFKEAKTQFSKDKMGEYFSALSNEANLKGIDFAYLVLGVKNDKTIIGTSINDDQLNEYKLEMATFTNPKLSFDDTERIEKDGKNIIVCKIPAAPKGSPVSWKGHCYGRDGESLGALHDNEREKIKTQNGVNDWSAQIVENATIDDLDDKAIKIAREKYKEKNTNASFYNDIDSWSTKQFLDKLKITINGKLTNTAILLLGKSEAVHFISPAVAQITWKLDTEEKAYEHFGIPFFTEINSVLLKIRNVKHKFFPDNQLIATEVMKYDTEVILEALNNCIAHQDYSKHARILLTEQIHKLIFSNEGSFYEGTAEDYTLGEKTPKKYRNKWLADAMVNLNMIDSLGYGIHRMYNSQRKRYFPLPDYTKSTRDSVILEIYGHTIDENYSKLLIEKKDNLNLTEVVLLDKVQKKLEITDEAAKLLKKKALIEGRKPNFFISVKIAELTNQKASYTKNKGLAKETYKGFILQHIKNHGFATRDEIDELLIKNLPSYMNDKQRKRKVDNLLQEMSGVSIINKGSNTKSRWELLNN